MQTTYRCNNFPLYFNHIKCAMAMLIWSLMVFAVVDLTTATVTRAQTPSMLV